MRIFAADLLITTLFCAPSWLQGGTQQQGKYAAAGLDNDQEVEQFFLSFKEAIAKEDKKKVAAMILYPIDGYLISGRRIKIRNKAELVSKYGAVFHRAFKQVILQTKVEDLWARYNGVGTDHGEIWFNGIEDKRRPGKYQIKITSLNGVFSDRK